MAKLSEAKAARGIGGPPMLHGSDLPVKIKSVNVTCRELREAPENFKSVMIMDFESPVYEKESWAVNVTNIKILSEKFGLGDDPDLDDLAKKCKGKKLTLTEAMVNDPNKKKMVRSLFVG